MERLARLLGIEAGLDEVTLALRYHVEEEHPAAVGARLVTCADESERECSEAFQKSFVEHLLPAIKFWNRAPFRCSNLGGRYEWGSIPIAEQHFALPQTAGAFKIIVVKINAHVAMNIDGNRPHFGRMDRYQTQSVACGALHGLLDGQPLPFSPDLQEAFESEGLDRLTILRDPQQVDPDQRAFHAAVVNVRFQARHAVLDLQDHRPATPTKYVIAACVTLNRPGPDTELLCGYYLADCRTSEESIIYRGLGDDPSRYRVSFKSSRVRLEDDQLPIRRPARSHRRLIAEALARRPEADSDRRRAGAVQSEIPASTSPQHVQKLAQVLEEARHAKHHDHRYAKPMLQTLLGALMVVSPIPAALLLFAEGLASICHAHRLHRIARSPEHHDDAREVLKDFGRKMDALPPERSKEVIDTLLSLFAPAQTR